MASVIEATTNGGEMVWPLPIGSAISRYACSRCVGRHKLVARRVPHRSDHALVFHAGGDDLLFDHLAGQRTPIAQRLARRRRSMGRNCDEKEKHDKYGPEIRRHWCLNQHF